MLTVSGGTPAPGISTWTSDTNGLRNKPGKIPIPTQATASKVRPARMAIGTS